MPYFSITLPAPDDSADWGTLREVASAADDLDAALLTSAVALQLWHSRHTHCPICGTPTVESQAGWIRVCPNDASEHFPRTDPAVIMVVHDGGDRCLLGRGQAWGEGRFSTLAGFVEPGESLEGAVAREVWEEVAVGVTDVRYVASQPWPFPSSLMVGFVARVDGDPTLQVDAVEVVEAGWFTREEVARAAAHGCGRRGRAGRRPAAHLPEAVDLALPHRLLVVGRDRSLIDDSNCRVPRVVPAHDDVSEFGGLHLAVIRIVRRKRPLPFRRGRSLSGAGIHREMDGVMNGKPWPSSSSPAISTMASSGTVTGAARTDRFVAGSRSAGRKLEVPPGPSGLRASRPDASASSQRCAYASRSVRLHS